MLYIGNKGCKGQQSVRLTNKARNEAAEVAVWFKEGRRTSAFGGRGPVWMGLIPQGIQEDGYGSRRVGEAM